MDERLDILTRYWGPSTLRGRRLKVTKLRIRCADADFEVGYILSQGHFGNYTVYFGLINMETLEDVVGLNLKTTAWNTKEEYFHASKLVIKVGQKGVFRL